MHHNPRGGQVLTEERGGRHYCLLRTTQIQPKGSQIGGSEHSVDQDYTGGQPAKAAQTEGIRLEVVNQRETKKGFVLVSGAEWWNAPLPGLPGSDTWPATTSGCRLPQRASTGWPLPLSC